MDSGPHDRRPAIRAGWIGRLSCRHASCKVRTVSEHSPTRRKYRKRTRLNRGTDSPSNILLSPSISSHTCRPTRAPTWPHGLPATWRALCASYVGHLGDATSPQCRVATRVGPARHLTLAHAPRQPPPGLGRHVTCRYVKPFFCEFLIRNSIYKSIKNPKKMHKT